MHMLIADGTDPGTDTTAFYGSVSGGKAMTKNLNEYIDIKNVRHTVKHLILPNEDQVYKEKILEEIRDVLMKQKKNYEDNTV